MNTSIDDGTEDIKLPAALLEEWPDDVDDPSSGEDVVAVNENAAVLVVVAEVV